MAAEEVSGIVQTGDHSITQTGKKSVVVVGGDYHEAVEHVEDDRVVVDTTPEKLRLVYDSDYTSVQSDEIFALYKGKWLRVIEPVRDVSKTGSGSYMVTVKPEGFEGISVALFFDGDKWGDRLTVLSRGTRIQAIGQIEEASVASVVLYGCELESGRRIPHDPRLGTL